MPGKLDTTLAVLNGLLGDYLARTDNGLATTMGCVLAGEPVALTRDGILRVHPTPSARVCVLVHGVLTTESVWAFPDGSDYGSRLARDLGFTPFYLRYNSGRAIADNGALLAELLTQLMAAYPIQPVELVLIGYSMGGLLIRSACHVAAAASQPWLSQVHRAIYVGTPHSGAPAERAGRMLAKLLETIPDPYTRLIADVGNLRSSGLRDLGDADLRHADRASQGTRLSLRDARHPVPLLASMHHYLIAGSLTHQPYLGALFGDSIVPIASATAHGMRLAKDIELPEERVKILPGVSHLALAHHEDVYSQLKAWCEEAR
jgi:triacylglycerol lipase